MSNTARNTLTNKFDSTEATSKQTLLTFKNKKNSTLTTSRHSKRRTKLPTHSTIDLT